MLLVAAARLGVALARAGAVAAAAGVVVILVAGLAAAEGCIAYSRLSGSSECV